MALLPIGFHLHGLWGNLYEVQPRPFFRLHLMAGISVWIDITVYRSCMHALFQEQYSFAVDWLDLTCHRSLAARKYCDLPAGTAFAMQREHPFDGQIGRAHV